jgi:hypothetical protein
VYWEILGIEPTTNKKNIKLAYAKKLKAVRPEDDPQAFQELRKAYQWALKYCEHEEPYDEYNPDVELAEPAHEYNLIFDETQNANTQPKLITETLEAPQASDETYEYYSESEEETLSESQLEQDWNTLFDRVTANTQGNKISHWKFIEELPSMQDMNFKNDVSYKLFSMLSEINQISLLQHKALRIKPKVLNYLNSIFAWDTQWQHFQKEFGDKQTDAIIQYLGSGKARFKPQEPYLLLRVGALMLDIMMPILIGIALDKLFSLFGFQPNENINGSIAFIYWFLVIPIMEATPLQASIGKKVVGLMVINQYGERIAWYQSLFRNWLSLVSMALFKVTVWINLFLIYKYNTLLQDSLSRSYVTRSR